MIRLWSAEGTVRVPEFEPLQAEDPGTCSGGCPVGGPGPERPEPDHDEVPLTTVGGHATDRRWAAARPLAGSRSLRVRTTV